MEQTGKKITKVLIFLTYIYLNYISLRLNRPKKKRKIEKKKTKKLDPTPPYKKMKNATWNTLAKKRGNKGEKSMKIFVIITMMIGTVVYYFWGLVEPNFRFSQKYSTLSWRHVDISSNITCEAGHLYCLKGRKTFVAFPFRKFSGRRRNSVTQERCLSVKSMQQTKRNIIAY